MVASPQTDGDGAKRPSFLILDRVPERGPAVETEGSKLFMALKRLGCRVMLTGPGYSPELTLIPGQAAEYDVCLLCDNYPQDWDWHSFQEIAVPKLFWAIDSSHQSFPFVLSGNFQHVLFNNHAHIDEFMSKAGWSRQLTGHSFFPYAFDHTLASGWNGESYVTGRAAELHDLVFCGSMTPDRRERIRIFEMVSGRKITMLSGFGQEYVDNILKGKLHLNLPVLGDFNARHMDVLGLGRVMFTPYQPNSIAVIPEKLGTYFHSYDALSEKVGWLLNDDEARVSMAGSIRAYILDNHTYDHRAQTLVDLVTESYP